MSWGERSCKHRPCPIPKRCNMENCNVDCPAYIWDGYTSPDSEPSKGMVTTRDYEHRLRELEIEARSSDAPAITPRKKKTRNKNPYGKQYFK